MGFRLIKENTREYDERLKKKKHEQLITEHKRWCHLTTRDERGEQFLQHYAEVHRRSPATSNVDLLAASLADRIRSEAVRITSIQGNLEIERLEQLLKDLPAEA